MPAVVAKEASQLGVRRLRDNLRRLDDATRRAAEVQVAVGHRHGSAPHRRQRAPLVRLQQRERGELGARALEAEAARREEDQVGVRQHRRALDDS